MKKNLNLGPFFSETFSRLQEARPAVLDSAHDFLDTRRLDGCSPPMPGLSCSALAQRAGVSRQGVHDAVKRGVLKRGPDGLIDPSLEPNRSWIGLHNRGLDFRARDMRTYDRAPKPQRQKPVSNTTEIAEVERHSLTDQELDAIVHGVANRVEIGMSPIDQEFINRLEKIERELAALRQQQPRCTYEATLRDAVAKMGSIEFRFGVFFHQMCRLMRGEGLSVVEEAFGPVDPAFREPAPVKRRT